MKKWCEQFKTEDWVVVALSVILLILAIFIPNQLPSIPKHLTTSTDWYNTALLFMLVMVILYLGTIMLGKKLKGLLLSFIVVFAVSLLAQVTAAIPQVSYYGFESVFSYSALNVSLNISLESFRSVSCVIG